VHVHMLVLFVLHLASTYTTLASLIMYMYGAC
jgi:hypothetical protein